MPLGPNTFSSILSLFISSSFMMPVAVMSFDTDAKRISILGSIFTPFSLSAHPNPRA